MPKIHSTAVIDGDAELGQDVEIGPYTVITGPVRIGDRVKIIAQAHIEGRTEIGEDCVIHPFVAIGGLPQDYAFEGKPSYCRIGARNLIREGVTVHRGTIPESTTVVGDDCMLMVNSHVAHNCQVGNKVILTNGVLLAGHVHVGDNVVFGGASAAHQFVRVGEFAMIAGGSSMRQDVPPFMIVEGRNICRGINRIGLRRNGFSQDDINELRRLHKQIFRAKRPLRDVSQELRDEAQTAAGRRLIEFILAESRRGVGRRFEE